MPQAKREGSYQPDTSLFLQRGIPPVLPARGINTDLPVAQHVLYELEHQRQGYARPVSVAAVGKAESESVMGWAEAERALVEGNGYQSGLRGSVSTYGGTHSPCAERLQRPVLLPCRSAGHWCGTTSSNTPQGGPVKGCGYSGSQSRSCPWRRRVDDMAGGGAACRAAGGRLRWGDRCLALPAPM